MRALQLRYYGILRGALVRLGQRFPDDVCDGIRVSQCHLMIRTPSISERFHSNVWRRACTMCPAPGTLVTLAKFDTPPDAT